MTLFATGGAAAFRKSMYLQLQGFNAIYYPLYWEDIDLCYRALKRGWKVLYAPECIMYHKHQATIKTMYDTKQLSYITARNSYIFFWINITTLNILILHLFWSLTFFIRDIFKLKFRFHIAFCLALTKIFEIIKYRNLEKKQQKKTDVEIFEILN